MLGMLVLENMIVPPVLFHVKTKEEAIADIETIRVYGATRCAYRKLCWAHPRNILKRTLKITLKKRMKNALTIVSMMNTTILLTRP